VCGSSSSPNQTATSPPTTTGRPPVSMATTCMPRVWPGAGTSQSPGKQLELAVDRHLPHAGRLDPLANGVVVLAARVPAKPSACDPRFYQDGYHRLPVCQVRTGSMFSPVCSSMRSWWNISLPWSEVSAAAAC
jgi:hypothetical protein